MELSYSKRDNSSLFNDLEKMNIIQCQNYIPIYELFFQLNEKNYNSVTFQVPEKLLSIEKQLTYNTADAYVSTYSHKKKKKEVFIKYAPIADPIRYMGGKYQDIYITLPDFNNKHSTSEYHSKICKTFNSSYVDGLFSYLSSSLLKHNFLNAMSFHGMYLGIQKQLKVNIIDDLEFLTESSYFHEHLDTLFHIEDDDIFSIHSQESGSNKPKITIYETIQNHNIEQLDETIVDNNNAYVDLADICEIKDFIIDENASTISLQQDDSSDCSSASSLTENSSEIATHDIDSNILCEAIHNDKDIVGCSDESDEGDDDDDESEVSYIESVVNNFPVALICMEKCEGTLDQIMCNESIHTKQWKSCLFQVILTLAVFQKYFNFTHNDLHTSNIMYISTKQKHISYKWNGQYYKIPTYGKIFKIIDFGRSIFNYKNILIYSDAFEKKEDAATQYNFGPIFNENKKEVLPNPSFDLSRLACSLYDYFEDYPSDEQDDQLLKSLVEKWCTDDKGRNILYKASGEERYPDFKLYKMIARTIHHSVPEMQLQDPFFSAYKVEYDPSSTSNTPYIDLDNLTFE